MIKWLGKNNKGIPEEKPNHPAEVRETFREVFDTPKGRKALTYMLVDLGFYDLPVDEQSGEALTGEALVRYHALQGYARRVLEQLGALHEFNANRITDAMLNAPVWSDQNGTRRNHAE